MATALSKSKIVETKRELKKYWSKTTIGEEYTLHQLAPYIGKLKSSIARGLIIKFTKRGDTIYDPYSGSGTIPLEALALGRKSIANDLNPYAYLLCRAKLNPPLDINTVLAEIEEISANIELHTMKVDLRKVPKWVRDFFHRKTLKETIAWATILKEKESWFLFSCLLGILHHQRPGFLSFPSSHSVPYLRIKKFPIQDFPELYEYRDVKSRLIKKVKRAFRRMPIFHDQNNTNFCTSFDASKVNPSVKVNAIVTSPPYMRSLDYARDNRLRLWFLDSVEGKNLDKKISPSEREFLKSIKEALTNWKECLELKGYCILILGDSFCSSLKKNLPYVIEKIALSEVKGYDLIFKMRNLIPNKRRVRRNLSGNKYETILILQRKK